MYFVLYNRFLKSIGEPYVLESWSRTQRAVDLDSLRIEGAQIPFSADPFLVVVNDRQGKQMFSGLASTPVINDKTKKTSIILKDYLTLLNSDVMIDFSKFFAEYVAGATLGDYLNFVLNYWKEEIDLGFETVTWSVDSVYEEPLTHTQDMSSIQSVNICDHILGLVNYYNLYIVSSLDLNTKTLTYTFYPASLNSVSIRLKDFGVEVIEKSFGDYNRATVYNFNHVKMQQWALTKDNQVVKLPSNKELVYPAKNKNFIGKDPNTSGSTGSLNGAVFDAVMGLAQNRYQENVDLDAQKYKSVLDLTGIDFSYKVDVYTDDGYYKNLPVGEIVTDSKGKHIIRLGHRVQELTQEI